MLTESENLLYNDYVLNLYLSDFFYDENDGRNHELINFHPPKHTVKEYICASG